MTATSAAERAVKDLEARTRALEVPLGSWPGIAKRTLKRSSADRITTAAASLAFHWFLALFPAAIALLGLAGLVGLRQSQLRHLVHGIGVVLPAAAAHTLSQALTSPLGERAGVAALVFGSAIALWSGIESMAALQVGLDLAYEATVDRGFLRRRLVAFPLLLITVVLGGAGFALLVLGKPLGHLLDDSLGGAGGTFADIWSVARWVVALVLVSGLLSAYYAIGPNRSRSTRWEWTSPGGIVAGSGWLAASVAYSFYLNDLGHESRSYGTFAGVAVLLLWLFLAGLAVLLGAELNRELERSETGRTPGRQRGASGDEDAPSPRQ